MSLELENRVAELERKARATRVLLDAAIVEIKAAHARLVAIETRMNAPPITIDVRPAGHVSRRGKPSLAPPAVTGTPSPESVAVFPGGFVPATDVSDEVRASLRACHVDRDACSAEQRSGTGRAAQGTCVRGVVDLVAASADDQHAAERGTPAAGAEVTASEGGDTARADSVVAENAKAETMRKALANALGGLGSLTFLDGLKRVREMGAERDAMRHELAEMRAELERERVRRKAAEDALSKAATDPRNEAARRRGLTTGARVRLEGEQAHLGTVCGFDTDGDPIVVMPDGIERYYAFDLVTDTEATT